MDKKREAKMTEQSKKKSGKTFQNEQFKVTQESSPETDTISDAILDAIQVSTESASDPYKGEKTNWDMLIVYYSKNAKEAATLKDPLELYWLTRLGNCYAEMGNYPEFIKLFSRITQRKCQLEGAVNERIDIKNDDDIYLKWFSSTLIQEVAEKTQTIYGNDPKQAEAFIDAINYGIDDEPCLIIGETGTGKEIVANLIHKISRRKDNKFWSVNCGGFTESLFNSEIQGVVSGAATNVVTRLGAFLSACGRLKGERNKGYEIQSSVRGKDKIICKINGEKEPYPTSEALHSISGTLFLDEINSLPLGLQSALLRIIQEKEVMVVGEDKKRKYSAKVVCASNRDFSGNEKADGFRRDLYFRISKGIICLPSLRDIADSIPNIVDQMVKDMAQTIMDETNKKITIEVTHNALDKMINYSWPGNHRELKNVLYRALKKMVISSDFKLKHEHIDFGKSSNQAGQTSSIFEGKDIYQVNKMFVDFLLNLTGGNKSKAASIGGFKDTKQIYEILNPNDPKYKTTRFDNCESLNIYR